MSKDLLIDHIYNCDDSWLSFMKDNVKILENISSILEGKNDYIPSNDEVLSIFSKVKLQNIKVVIIGKEPYAFLYEKEPITDGCALSMSRNISTSDKNNNIPNDLKIVFHQLCKINKNYKFNTYSLDHWMKQGVFLINSSFTVEKCKPNSHIKRNFWKPFIYKLIKIITETNPDCVFMLWGLEASFLNSYISNSCTKFLSDYPNQISMDKFTGHLHMEETNKILIKKNKKPIDWSTY